MDGVVWSDSRSETNPKSKIQNLKWLGFVAIVAALVGLWGPAQAQEPGKVYRIGFLDYRLRSTSTDPQLTAFRHGLRELGYREGRNLVIDYRPAEGKDERISEVATGLVKLKVDVIVTSGSPQAIRAAKQVTRLVPIIFASTSFDPVEAGFVESLARPGGNITGLTNISAELHPKRLELLKGCRTAEGT